MKFVRYISLWGAWGLLGLTSACVNTRKLGTVYIYRGQKLSRNEYIDQNNLGKGVCLVTYTLKEGAEVKIKPQDTLLDITPAKPMEADTVRIPKKGSEIESPTNKPGYYFDSKQSEAKPEGKADEAKSEKDYVRGNSLRYLEISPSVQATTIPIKIRPGLNNKSAYSATGSFNVGVSYGMRFTHNVYRSYYSSGGKDKAGKPTKQIFLNSRTNKFTFMPGLFAGPSLVELKPANTDNAVQKDRTVLGLTTGIIGVVAINQFSLGGAVGWDLGLGSPATRWNYHKKRWYGIVLALDFLK